MSALNVLTLEVAEFVDLQHWMWRLKTPRGRVLVEHPVSLNADSEEYRAFMDLDAYLRINAAPDTRRDDERRLVDQVGDWIGRIVLGPVAVRILEEGTPAVVRTLIPAASSEAVRLLYLPFDLGYVGGRPLSLKDVTFVHEIAGPVDQRKPHKRSGHLKILAVFSLPTGTSPLALREERFQLQDLITRLARTRAIELRILQFGATFEALERMIGEGWDVVHFAGHGLAAGLLLEAEGGGDRRVSSDEIVSLLRKTQKRLQWVTLSTCQSGAEATSEALVSIGLEPLRSEPELDAIERAAAGDPGRQLAGLARVIVSELDCAVLAMRYPVDDAFATPLTAALYTGVLEEKQPLPRAVQNALKKTVVGGRARPLSVATPALFGRQSARLALDSPSRASTDTAVGALSVYLPASPAHFVGRTAEMTRASAALAKGSAYGAVLFHGMAGAGKTTCALELAHHYSQLDRFQSIVWFKAPDAGHNIGGSLGAFAQQWEIVAPLGSAGEHGLIGAVEADDAFFERTLTKVASGVRQTSVLVVVDNVESLLDSDCRWIAPRWEQFIGALIVAGGPTRVIMTSRVVPVFEGGEDRPDVGPVILDLPVHAFSLNEAALLASQLPNLGALMRGDRAGDQETKQIHRQVVQDTIRVTQGHPKLLMLAESQAEQPDRLKVLVDDALVAGAFGEDQLSAFFAEGASAADPEQFFAALGAWTNTVAGALDPGVRPFFECLCCLEEPDRCDVIVEALWPQIRLALDYSDRPARIEAAVDVLRRAALVDVPAVDKGPRTYYIHPGIAEASRTAVAAGLRKAVEESGAAYWSTVYATGLETEDSGGGPSVVQGGLRAAPYLMSLARWGDVAEMLEEVRFRDESATTTSVTVPLLRRVVEETLDDPLSARYVRIYGSALLDAAQLDTAEDMLHDAAEQSTALGDHKEASVALDELIDLMRRTGRSQEALDDVFPRMSQHTYAAGLGELTRISDEGWKLHLLYDVGQDEEVIQGTERLLHSITELAAKPKTSAEQDPTTVWTVRENILAAGRLAAVRLKLWDSAVEWNNQSILSQTARHAPALEIQRLRVKDCEPLVGMAKYPAARTLALESRVVFVKEKSAQDIAVAFVALASIDAAQRRLKPAIAHARTALRYRYLAGDPAACAESHFQIASLLARAEDRPAALLNRIASALIRLRVSSGDLKGTLDALRVDAREVLANVWPATFAAFVRAVGNLEGVSFEPVFDKLPSRDNEDPDRLLVKLIEETQSDVHVSRRTAGSAVPAQAPTAGEVVVGAASAAAWTLTDATVRGIREVGDHPIPAGAVQYPEYCTIPVYYATDRVPAPAEGYPAYTGRLGSELRYGFVRVSVPSRREKADLPRPRWWLLEFRDNQTRHVTLLDGAELSADLLKRQLRTAMADTPEALVFIHGYNVAFSDALRRTAQIAYDLYFPGATLLYSWPSEGRVFGYRTDGENARISADRFSTFLKMVMTETGARTVYVLAHSMGNRVLVEALRDMDAATLPEGSGSIRELILAAPDVRSEFVKNSAAKLAGIAKRVTLYASSTDRALKWARRLQGGYPRAGYARDEILVLPDVDTIDASNVHTDFLEHSFYGGSRSILDDLFQLIRNGQSPMSRGLTRRMRDGLPYWIVPA